ncbi:unnamed protein product, partial [marine sediment metagenome]
DCLCKKWEDAGYFYPQGSFGLDSPYNQWFKRKDGLEEDFTVGCPEK